MRFYVTKILIACWLVIMALYSPAQNNYTLKQAISQAKANNPLLKNEKFNIDIAQSDVVTAKLRPNPILNNQTLQLLNPSLFPENTTSFSPFNRQVWWQLTKPVQLPTQRRYKIEFASQTHKLTEKNYYETERNISLKVANKWLDGWIIKTKLGLLQQAQVNLDSLVKINEVRLKNQVITSTDAIRTQLLLDQYNLQLNSIKQEYKNEIQNLKLLLGTSDSADIDINAAIESLSIIASYDSLLNQALKNRTDILTIQNTVDLSMSNINLQKSLAWPQPELGFIWNPQNTIPYAGVFATIDIPVFSRNQGEIQKSKIIRQQAEQNLQSTQLKIQTEITSAYQLWQTQKQNLQKFEGILKQSQTVLDNVKYAYLKGGTTIIDFLDAQRNWYDTRQLYYETQLSYYKSYIQLLYSTGLINQL